MTASQKRKNGRPTFAEYAVFALFVGVVVFGVYYVVSQLSAKNPAPATPTPSASTPKVPARVAPTPAQYQDEVRGVMAPFLELEKNVKQSDFANPDPALKELVAKTQERLLAVIVPKEYRDAHLSFILLLDQWKRALDGSKPDQKTVLKKTADTVAANAWLTTAPSAPSGQ